VACDNVRWTAPPPPTPSHASFPAMNSRFAATSTAMNSRFAATSTAMNSRFENIRFVFFRYLMYSDIENKKILKKYYFIIFLIKKYFENFNAKTRHEPINSTG
jgi:hypothetical protein